MDKVRAALIGAGSMANAVHYPSLAEMDDVEMVGLCDMVEEKLNATADKFGIEYRTNDYKQMLEDVAPDAVWVLMPAYHMSDIVVHCLKQGLHVFVEKPPAVTTYQTLAFADLAAKHDALSMTGFNRRFIPLLIQCRDKVREHGDIMQAVSTFNKWYPGDPYYDGAIDILYTDAVHSVDMLRWMGGDVDQVVSDVKFNGREFQTSWVALTRHASGCTGVLLTNWMVGGRVHTFEMHARGISAFCNPDEGEGAVIHIEDELGAVKIGTEEAAGTSERHHYYGFFGENRHFVDCVKAGIEPETCFADAAKSMELCDRIYSHQM